MKDAPHPQSATRYPQFAILACFLLLGIIYGLVTPPFENLDEIEHFGAVRYIAETGQLPVHGTPEAEVYHYRQEASQPPLYHVLAAGLVRLLRLRTDDAPDFWRFNPRVVCGPGGAGLYDDRAIFYHNPNREAFPWRGALLTLHVLRLWSTLLQVVTVAGAYALARLAFPQRREIGWLAMAIVAFNPQFLLVASGANNDNVVTPLVTVGLYVLLRAWQDGLSAQRAVSLGILTGLAGLSKLSGWGLLGLAGLVTLAMVIRARKIQWQLVMTAALIPAIALAIAGWWFWRNWQLYGDPTALRPMLDLVGRRNGSLIQPLLETSWMFRSFWGQIPCSFYPPPFYVFYAVLTALALGGLAWGWRRLDPTERSAAAILAGWFLLVVVSWMRWDALTPAPGGRLLFPALPAVALLMAVGINHSLSLIRRLSLVISHWSLVIFLLALMACWTAARILPGFFAPPPRYSDANALSPEHPLDATFGDAARLLGYDVTLTDREPTLDVTLYWQAVAPLTEDYVMALQLVSPVPGDTTLRWNYNSWPGRGNYPTSAWQPGEAIADRYQFRLPEADFATQAWDVHLALYQKETGERLPVQIGGTSTGDKLVLTRLRVPGRQPACPEEDQLEMEAHFGEAIALTHARVTPGQNGIRVELCWKALQSQPTDYTVFVHLENAAGELAGDGPPMQGAFPTSLWRPGDIILDVHHLPVSSEQGAGRITVGLYRLDDGSRLPASIGDVPVPDAAVPVWPDHP